MGWDGLVREGGSTGRAGEAGYAVGIGEVVVRLDGYVV